MPVIERILARNGGFYYFVATDAEAIARIRCDPNGFHGARMRFAERITVEELMATGLSIAREALAEVVAREKRNLKHFCFFAGYERPSPTMLAAFMDRIADTLTQGFSAKVHAHAAASGNTGGSKRARARFRPWGERTHTQRRELMDAANRRAIRHIRGLRRSSAMAPPLGVGRA